MPYVISYKEPSGEGASYRVSNYLRAIKAVTRLLEHGTKYQGTPAQTITITKVAVTR